MNFQELNQVENVSELGSREYAYLLQETKAIIKERADSILQEMAPGTEGEAVTILKNADLGRGLKMGRTYYREDVAPTCGLFLAPDLRSVGHVEAINLYHGDD
ncbi:MAG: hypothetical protein GY938_16950 [Ketobacter sp.]|nr:hypothetical protein [Ketobacter sp.]